MLKRKKIDISAMESGPYNPFAHRQVAKPLTNKDAFINTLKMGAGSGVLNLPYAFKQSGLVVGFIGTFIIGVISAHCIQILVNSSHKLCKRLEVPMLDYAETARHAFIVGPKRLQRFANFMSWLVKGIFLFTLGPCAIYVVLMSSTIKGLVDHYQPESDVDIRFYILAVWVPLALLCLIPDLKYVVPFSNIGSASLGLVLVITFYYSFEVIEDPNDRKFVGNIEDWPIFLVTTAFSMECAQITLSIENQMKRPKHYVGPPYYVFFIVIALISVFDAFIGFFGYLRFGEGTKASVHLNLLEGHPDDVLASAAQYLLLFAVLISHTLVLFIPTILIWTEIKEKVPKNRQYAYLYLLRLGLATFSVLLAVAVPNLGPIISMAGSISIPFIGFIIPAAVELTASWSDGYGKGNWIMWKDFFLIFFAILVSMSGVYATIRGILYGDN